MHCSYTAQQLYYLHDVRQWQVPSHDLVHEVSNSPPLQVLYHVGVQLDITAPPTPKTPKTKQPPASHQPSRLSTGQPGSSAQEGESALSASEAVHSLGPSQDEQTQRPAPLQAPAASERPQQSPAASEQPQDYQQPATVSDSIDIPTGQQQRHQQQQNRSQDQQQLDQQQQQSPSGSQRQLLQRQSAPAGSGFAAAAARAAMLPDVSHLHINAHASHASQKAVELPECSEVSKQACAYGCCLYVLGLRVYQLKVCAS